MSISKATAPYLPSDIPVAETVLNKHQQDDTIPVVQAVPIPTTMNRAPEEIISNFDKNSDIRPISKELAQVNFVLLSYFMSIFL